MANEVFVDTSGFYASLCERDPMHEKAAALLTQAAKEKRRFVTTDRHFREAGFSVLLCSL